MEQLADVPEAARLLKTTPGAVYAMCSRKQLPHIKFGKRLRFKVADLERFLESKIVEPAEPVDYRRRGQRV